MGNTETGHLKNKYSTKSCRKYHLEALLFDGLGEEKSLEKYYGCITKNALKLR